MLRSCLRVGAWIAAGAVAASCSASAPPSPPQTNQVRLVRNQWDASKLDVAIANQLLTSQLGMAVTVTDTDEFSQWPAMSSGSQDACLEVWPSGHVSDIQNYIDTGKVENGGPLGPIGKISWYVPTYMLIANPALASYEAYRDPANTTPLATAETGTKGRLLSGDPSWTSYDKEIIATLGLNLDVVYAGNEDNELAELDAVYQRRGPILLYLWTPHVALAKYDLTAVALPPYTPACYAKITSGTVDCDYPPDQLFKIFWPGFADVNPRAYGFLKNMRLTTEDQINLLALLYNQKMSPDQAASNWISANQSLWQTWIPSIPSAH